MTASKTSSKSLTLFFAVMTVSITATFVIWVHHYLDQPPSARRINVAAPDFSAFTSASEKKKAFFNYLLPMIKGYNRLILEERTKLLDFEQSLKKDKLDKPGFEFIDELVERYQIQSANLSYQEKLQRLKKRVDLIPASLVLATAAKESGWGTSKYAREDNNYFSLRCHETGCGVIPEKRSSKATYEIQTFGHTSDSVGSFFKNLNTKSAYEGFRNMRANLRTQGQISGLKLSEQLRSQSQRRKTYIREVQSIIHSNKLAQLDQTI